VLEQGGKIVAGADGSLDADVENCYDSCDFEWYVDGKFVGSDVDSLTVTTTGDLTAEPALFFTAHSTLVHAFSAGVHPVMVQVTDALDRTIELETTVTAVAATPPATDTVDAPTSAGGSSIPTALVVLGVVCAAAFAAGRRIRPDSAHP
jgi:hypothetical protein